MTDGPVAVLGPGRGKGLGPSLFVYPQFFHRLLIIDPPSRRSEARPPQSVLAITATETDI